ncbi:uncharacterized protein LOC125026282 [Penaeus chinensis]|uniref:uncharacterized protein LOC125026282 n=1 Tax=Penaeus chinensis TaxID=139456 RepID=UPI001FB5DDCD|nr:uncharacterized protein LOC125026282 [Penaeus chinensis]
METTSCSSCLTEGRTRSPRASRISSRRSCATCRRRPTRPTRRTLASSSLCAKPTPSSLIATAPSVVSWAPLCRTSRPGRSWVRIPLGTSWLSRRRSGGGRRRPRRRPSAPPASRFRIILF